LAAIEWAVAIPRELGTKLQHNQIDHSFAPLPAGERFRAMADQHGRS